MWALDLQLGLHNYFCCQMQCVGDICHDPYFCHYDKYKESTELKLEFTQNKSLSFTINTSSLDEVLMQSDFITLHVPAQKEYIIGKDEFDKIFNDG